MNRFIILLVIFTFNLVLGKSLFAQYQVPKYGFDFLYTNLTYEDPKYPFPQYKNEGGDVVSILADSNLIVSALLGSKRPTSDLFNLTTYLSFHRINGEQIRVKKLDFSPLHPALAIGLMRQTNNLGKVSHNKYVVGLNGIDSITYPNYSHGFHGYAVFHYFNNEGDSLKTVLLIPKDSTQTLFVRGLATDKEGNTIGALQSMEGKDTVGLTVDSFLYGGPFVNVGTIMVKLNKNGDTVWMKKITPTYSRGVGENSPYSISINPDGTRYTIFYSKNYFTYALQTDSNGNVIWNRRIPHLYDADTSAIGNLSRFVFIVHGCYGSDGNLYYTMVDSHPPYISGEDTISWMQQINYGRIDPKDGSVIWAHNFDVPGNSNNGHLYRMDYSNMAALNNNKIVMTTPYYSSGWNSLVFLFDSEGNVIWNRNVLRYDFPSRKNLEFPQIMETATVSPQNKILIGGYLTYSGKERPNDIPEQNWGGGPYDHTYPWLVMLDEQGRRCEADTIAYDNVPDCLNNPYAIGDDPEQQIGRFLVRVYPNPTDDYVQVDVLGDNVYQMPAQLVVWDALGRRLFSHDFEDSYRLKVAGFPAGVYMFQVRVGGQSITKKIVVE